MNPYFDPYADLQRQLDQIRGQSMPQMQAPIFETAEKTNVVWVQGIEGAKGTKIQHGASVIMLDSENEDTMYIKYSDPAGLCKMKTFKFKEVDPPASGNGQYVTREDVRNIILEMMGKADDDDKVVSGDCWIKDAPADSQQ
ncbi:MAG: hypothetical protein IKH57_21175 [Clostridia bacterium]|nr:hypothetical protein [Clostridia bacterium]